MRAGDWKMVRLGNGTEMLFNLRTAWSTNQGRQGSYNLYYCASDKITGPDEVRKFAN